MAGICFIRDLSWKNLNDGGVIHLELGVLYVNSTQRYYVCYFVAAHVPVDIVGKGELDFWLDEFLWATQKKSHNEFHSCIIYDATRK